MKKTGIFVALCLAASLFATGCGGDSKDDSKDASSGSEATENTSSVSGDDLDTTPIVEGEFVLEECITLGNYKGLKLTRDVAAVSDEDVENYIRSLMVTTEVTDPDAVVQEGDTVNLAFEGTRDGVAFEGGTSSSYDLVIGSGSFIPGFEDGMIGMKVGESRDLNLTFPETYQNEEMRGADVVFHVTVNKISRTPDLTDEWVLEYTSSEYTTVAEYRQYVRELLETNRQNTALQTMRQEAWSQVRENCSFLQLPASYVEDGKTEFENSITQEAAYSGMDLETYVQSKGLTQEEYESKKDQYGRIAAESRLMLAALQKAEGLSTEDKEYQEGLETLAQAYGVDAETLIDSFGEDTVEQYVMTSLIMDRILGYAEITDAAE